MGKEIGSLTLGKRLVSSACVPVVGLEGLDVTWVREEV